VQILCTAVLLFVEDARPFGQVTDHLKLLDRPEVGCAALVDHRAKALSMEKHASDVAATGRVKSPGSSLVATFNAAFLLSAF
jgi:hypothetical protein